MTKLYLLTIVCGLGLYSCKTAGKAYQKGEYTDAIELGVKKLQKNPNDYDTRALVQKSYGYEVTEHEDEIRILSNSQSDARFDNIYQQYSHLQHFYDYVHQYPAVSAMIQTKDYSPFLETYRMKAAASHSEKAAKWMAEATKAAYREAYKEYCVASNYLPDNFDLRKSRDMAYDAAITKVIISPMQNYSWYQYSSSYQLQNFQTDIVRTLAVNMKNDMIRFYPEWEAKNKNIQPDQIMEINFSRIIIGQPYDETNTREISKEVVVKEVVSKTDSVSKQYSTVRAKVITTKRTLLSQGDLYITVRDTRGAIIWNDRFTGEYRWEAEFSTYTGDERALSDSDKVLLNKPAYKAPGENQIMQELMTRIQNDLTNRLRGYYTRFQ